MPEPTNASNPMARHWEEFSRDLPPAEGPAERHQERLAFCAGWVSAFCWMTQEVTRFPDQAAEKMMDEAAAELRRYRDQLLQAARNASRRSRPGG